MKYIILALIFAMLSAMPAHAAGRCYASEEMQAEQLLRLHSELMVITVTCKQGATGRDLVRPYVGFTQRHTKAIQKAEATLMRYYAKTYGEDGTSRLDKLRTKLANEFGQVVADESAPVFCARARDKVLALYDSPSKTVLEDNIRSYRASLSYEPLCKDSEIKTAAATIPSDKASSSAKKKRPKADVEEEDD